MKAGNFRMIVSLLAAVVVGGAVAAGAPKNFFPSFADDHTVGLWLFDETEYPYTTMTDASKYEYDLRLMKGGQLVKGRFGNCLKCTPGLDHAVGYAAWKGIVAFNHMREMSGRPGSGLWGPTVAPEKLLNALDGRDFTCEFWLLLMSNPIQEVTLIDLGDKYEPGFSLALKKRAAGFVIENAYVGFRSECPSILDQLWGRAWHHVAFTYSASSRRLEFFIDGKLQDAPEISSIPKTAVPVSVRPESLRNTTYGIFEKADRRTVPDFEKRRANRFNFAAGHDRRGDGDFNGNIDELRFSDVIRYTADFALADSLSRNYRKGAPEPTVANGPPLLFGTAHDYLPNQPVMLGSRKHVFIDRVMVEAEANIRQVVNRPHKAVVTDAQAAWDASFFDYQGKICTLVSEGYGSDAGPIGLLVSADGIHFAKPNLGLIEYEGSTNNNLVMMGLPSWGKYYKDTNPACPAEELIKATLWVAQRGIYMYFSPDGIHWRRNETCMLPLVSGGGCETFWDDQQGMYVNYIKRDGSYNTGDYPAYGRGATLFQTREPAKAWPFKPVPNPYYEGWAFPAVTGEGITVMGPDLINPNKGQIFRTRAQKYEWAPDAYLAFMFDGNRDIAVSRDAVNWKIRPELGAYLEKGGFMNESDWKAGLKWKILEQLDDKSWRPNQQGRSEKEPLIAGEVLDVKDLKTADLANGMIRRGNEIWQFGNCLTSDGRKATVRFTQRLDGFFSLDAGEQTGTIITRPLIFEGEKLILNVNAAKGSVKVAMLGLAGKEMTGFNVALKDPPKKDVRCYSIKHCVPITADSVRHTVTWKGSSDVGSLAGQVVRLRFEMQNAKVFAFQFE